MKWYDVKYKANLIKILYTSILGFIVLVNTLSMDGNMM